MIQLATVGGERSIRITGLAAESLKPPGINFHAELFPEYVYELLVAQLQEPAAFEKLRAWEALANLCMVLPEHRQELVDGLTTWQDFYGKYRAVLGDLRNEDVFRFIAQGRQLFPFHPEWQRVTISYEKISEFIDDLSFHFRGRDYREYVELAVALKMAFPDKFDYQGSPEILDSLLEYFHQEKDVIPDPPRVSTARNFPVRAESKPPLGQTSFLADVRLLYPDMERPTYADVLAKYEQLKTQTDLMKSTKLRGQLAILAASEVTITQFGPLLSFDRVPQQPTVQQPALPPVRKEVG